MNLLYYLCAFAAANLATLELWKEVAKMLGARHFEAEIARLRHRMNQLFSEFSREGEGPEPLDESGWIPPLDVSENKDDIVVRVDVPGVKPDEIDLSISGDVLHIKGERKRKVKREDENYHTVERGYGKFHRRIDLPTSADVDGIRASYEDGVLTVRLPKLEEEKTGTIKVNLE